MKERIYLKTQTARSTNFKEGIENINIGIKSNKKDFEFGICAVKYWGDFEPRGEPLLSDFIKEIKPILSKKKYKKDYH